MSNTANSTSLSTYNSLLDKNLTGYFSNTKTRKHLVKSGMIDKEGRIVSENAYRMKMARKEHRENVRDMLASAIVDKALDMERMRRYEIKKRLEELYKIELVQKVRSERGKRVNDDLVALLTPRKQSAKPRKSKSAAVTKIEKGETKLPNIHSKSVESTFPARPDRLRSGPAERKKLNPRPPPQGKGKKKKRSVHRGLMLAKSDQMVAHRIQLQSMAEVTMKYLGSPLNLTNDMFPSNKVSEVQIIQQHCGASTICVFKELLPANTLFTFVSRRHRGSPFGLTFYINGLQNIRVSSCCEYKHKPGHRVGGKNSQFALVAVQGAAPCYKCQVRLNLVDDGKEQEQENEASSSDEEAAVKSFDIIVSRMSRRPDSSRPESATVETQTLKGLEPAGTEANDYQDDDFEDDTQFAQKQEEMSSDHDELSSSDSDAESDLGKDDKDDSDSDSSSVASKDNDYTSEKYEDDHESENAKETESDLGDTSDSDASVRSVEANDIKEVKSSDSSETEEASDTEEASSEIEDKETEKKAESNMAQEGTKDVPSDEESTVSVSSKSENESEKEEEEKDTKEETETALTSEGLTSAVDDEIEEKDEEVSDMMVPEDAQKTNEKENDSGNSDSSSTSEASSAEEEEEEEVGETKELETTDDIKKQDEIGEITNDIGTINLKKDESGSESSDSESDDNRGTIVISRESTMLTGNEDGGFDGANNTIQFNEEVDVLTYAKGDSSSTEETPRSDDSEGDFEAGSVSGGNVKLADVGDDSEDDNDLDDDDLGEIKTDAESKSGEETEDAEDADLSLAEESDDDLETKNNSE